MRGISALDCYQAFDLPSTCNWNHILATILNWEYPTRGQFGSGYDAKPKVPVAISQHSLMYSYCTVKTWTREPSFWKTCALRQRYIPSRAWLYWTSSSDTQGTCILREHQRPVVSSTLYPRAYHLTEAMAPFRNTHGGPKAIYLLAIARTALAAQVQNLVFSLQGRTPHSILLTSALHTNGLVRHGARKGRLDAAQLGTRTQHNPAPNHALEK